MKHFYTDLDKMARVNVLFLLSIFVRVTISDKPCAARDVGGESVVCVCNASYCDTITRVLPGDEEYIVYTSSRAGSRFKKSFGKFKTTNKVTCPVTFVLEPEIKHQTIQGFGAAITDSAAINWMRLSLKLRQRFIDTYFSEKGIEYSMLRVPIGGTDFSTHKYAYNELPKNDILLSNFTLSEEDYKYKIPMIKQAFAASRARVHIVSTLWAPPSWMVETSNYTTCGRLQFKYYSTLVDYHLKFLEHYERAGVSIWAITTTNEPANGFLPLKKFNCLAWSPNHMGLWIVGHLGPKIRGSKFCQVKILGIDDQRHTIPLWFIATLEEHPAVLYYLDGFAIHDYSNLFAPPEQLTLITRPHPEKFILSTEFCEGATPGQEPKVNLGSWTRLQSYLSNILTDLNFDVVGWIDWNICLDKQGGPTWNGNFVDSPVIVAPSKGEFYKQPMFYAMGHVSKFIPRGSRRIDVRTMKCNSTAKTENFSFVKQQDIIQSAAFLTPYKTVVVILHNKGPATTLGIQLRSQHASINIEAESIVTVEFNKRS